MRELYFDGSGDQGLQRSATSSQSSRFYIQCVIDIKTDEAKETIKKKFAELRKRFGIPSNIEFKYHKRLRPEYQQVFFDEIAKLDFIAYVGVLDKDNRGAVIGFKGLKGNELTNNLIAQLLAEYLSDLENFHLYVDKENDQKVSEQAMRAEIARVLKSRDLELNIKCEKVTGLKSTQEDCLQLADMIAGHVGFGFKNDKRDCYSNLEQKGKLKIKVI